MKQISKDDFEQIYNTLDKTNISGKPFIVDFFADWCSPCKAFAPVLDDVSKELGITAYKIDVEQEHELAQAFSVRSLPTILIFDQNGQMTTSVGQVTANIIRDKIKLACGL